MKQITILICLVLLPILGSRTWSAYQTWHVWHYGVPTLIEITNCESCTTERFMSKTGTYITIEGTYNNFKYYFDINKYQCNYIKRGGMHQIRLLENNSLAVSPTYPVVVELCIWSGVTLVVLIALLFNTFNITRRFQSGFIVLCTLAMAPMPTHAQIKSGGMEITIPNEFKESNKLNNSVIYVDSNGASICLSKIDNPKPNLELFVANSVIELSKSIPGFSLIYEDKNVLIDGKRHILIIYKQSINKDIVVVHSYFSLMENRIYGFQFYSPEAQAIQYTEIWGDVMSSLVYR